MLTGFAVVVAAERSDRDAAPALVDHVTGDEAMRAAARRAGVAPVLEATWLDRSATPTILTALELQRSIEQARPRPVTPAYAFVSRAIYTNVHAALTGRLSPEQALDRADRQIERALARHG